MGGWPGVGVGGPVWTHSWMPDQVCFHTSSREPPPLPASLCTMGEDSTHISWSRHTLQGACTCVPGTCDCDKVPPGGLKHRNVLSPSGGEVCEIEASAGRPLSRGSGEETCLFQPLALRGTLAHLGLWPHCCRLCLHCHMPSSWCLCALLF